MQNQIWVAGYLIALLANGVGTIFSWSMFRKYRMAKQAETDSLRMQLENERALNPAKLRDIFTASKELYEERIAQLENERATGRVAQVQDQILRELRQAVPVLQDLIEKADRGAFTGTFQLWQRTPIRVDPPNEKTGRGR